MRPPASSALVGQKGEYMRSMRVLIAAAVTLVVVLGGLTAPASGQAAGNAVTEWNMIAVNTLVALPLPAGGAPPASQINMGMTQGAVYDAVNAIGPIHHRPYLLKRRFPSRTSEDAAVATAAYTVLSNIVSTVPAYIPMLERTVYAAVATAASTEVLEG